MTRDRQSRREAIGKDLDWFVALATFEAGKAAELRRRAGQRTGLARGWLLFLAGGHDKRGRDAAIEANRIRRVMKAAKVDDADDVNDSPAERAWRVRDRHRRRTGPW